MWIRDAVPRAFPLDLLVRTPADLAERLRRGDCLRREVIEQGQVLCEVSLA